MQHRRNLGAVLPVDAMEKTAIITKTETRDWQHYTFATLHEIANGVARALVREGLEAKSRVGVLALNSAEYMAVVLGIMRAGFVAVPINVKFPSHMIADILDECEMSHVFCDSAHQDLISGDCRRVLLDADGPQGLNGFLDSGPFDPITPEHDDTALMLYTSGTTGRPKGVRLSHRGQLWVMETRHADHPGTANERYLVAAPLYHMNAFSFLFLTLGAGACCVLLPRFDTRAYDDGMKRWQCTWVTAVPPMIAMLLRDDVAREGAGQDCVKVVRLGSAVVTPQLRHQIRQLWPQAMVINAYGTTESGPVTFAPVSDEYGAPVGTLGREHPGVEVRLVDEQGKQAELGTLEVRSPAAMLGYFRRPDVANPFTDDGFYRTGDVFRRDALGLYYFVGRHDDMFVCGGENIFPGEVEVALERHAAIEQVCLVPIVDEVKGHKPVAFVVIQEGEELNEEEIQEYARSVLPVYQYPRRVFFLPEMPLAGTNKIDREKLKRDAAMRCV